MNPGPFLRGCAFGGIPGIPYPRANPQDMARIPADTWLMAQFPVGVRLEIVGDAEAIDLAYETRMHDLLREGAGRSFAVWRGGRQVDERPAAVGKGVVRLSLGNGAPDGRAIVYLPDGMKPTLLDVAAVGGSMHAAPPQPRWIVYGDSIVEGWNASAPALAWPHVAAREQGLDVYNLGFAGSARGEIPIAEQIAELPADVITLAFGTNCWSRTPYSTGLMRETLVLFLDLIRRRHRHTPLVVATPTIRPSAEEVPNLAGATQADLRRVMEDVVMGRIAGGDDDLQLVKGLDLIGPEHLDDEVHPNDDGHRAIAAAVGQAVRGMVR